MLIDLSLCLPEIEDARFIPHCCPLCDSGVCDFLTIPKQLIVYECGGSYEFLYNQENRRFWNAKGKCDTPPHRESFMRIIKEAKRAGCLYQLYYGIQNYIFLGKLEIDRQVIAPPPSKYNNLEI